jgi:hypothetical protein
VYLPWTRANPIGRKREGQLPAARPETAQEDSLVRFSSALVGLYSLTLTTIPDPIETLEAFSSSCMIRLPGSVSVEVIEVVELLWQANTLQPVVVEVVSSQPNGPQFTVELEDSAVCPRNRAAAAPATTTASKITANSWTGLPPTLAITRI